MTQAFHVADAIPLPHPSETIVGRAARNCAAKLVAAEKRASHGIHPRPDPPLAACSRS